MKKRKKKEQAEAQAEVQTEAQGEGAEQEEPKPKKKKIIMLLIPVLIVLIGAGAAVYFFVLKDMLGGGGEVPPPEATAAADEIEVIDRHLPTEYVMDGKVVTAMTPAEEERDVRAVQAKTVTYTYNNLADPGTAVADYVTQMTRSGYSVVDAEFVTTSEPDYTAEAGSVLLARNKKSVADAEGAEDDSSSDETGDGEDGGAEPEPEGPMVVTLALSWSVPEGVCVVVIDEAEGSITSTPAPETLPTMTLSEAVDFFSELSPADLGLGGESMDEYHIYALNGTVLVDGQPCLRLNVYAIEGSAHASEASGTYFMTGDGSHIYRLDAVAGTVTEVGK